MELDFPAAPTTGQKYSRNGVTWAYDSTITAWAPVDTSYQGVEITPTTDNPFMVTRDVVGQRLRMMSSATGAIHFVSENTALIPVGSRVTIVSAGAATAIRGALDVIFNPNANGSVSAIAIQSDGKVLLGGFFTTVGGVTRNRIARLNSDGTLDTGFNPNASATVNAIAIQSDGKVLLGGQFTTVGGVTRNRIARLNLTSTVLSGTTITTIPQYGTMTVEKQTSGDWLVLSSVTRTRT